MQTALHKDLPAAKIDEFLNFRKDRFDGKDITFAGIIGRPTEIAEAAAAGTNIREIDIAVDDVGPNGSLKTPANFGAC
jgi:hypothetical protein